MVEMWWPKGDDIKRRSKEAGFHNANDLATAAQGKGNEPVSQGTVLMAMRSESISKSMLMKIALALGCKLEDIATPEPPPAKGPYGHLEAVLRRNKINPKRFYKAMAELNIDLPTLAAKSGVSENAIKNGLDGTGIDGNDFKLIAEILGLITIQLLPDAPPLEIATEKPRPPNHSYVLIVIRCVAGMLDVAIRENWPGRIVAFLHGLLMELPKLVSMGNGSIRIVLDMNNDDANRLVEAWEGGQLDYLDIAGVRILPPRTRWSDYLGAIFGGIGIISCLLGLYEPIRFPAAIVALLSALSGLLFLGRSIYVRLQR